MGKYYDSHGLKQTGNKETEREIKFAGGQFRTFPIDYLPARERADRNDEFEKEQQLHCRPKKSSCGLLAHREKHMYT